MMKLTPEETDAYAKAVVQADFEEAGDEDVIRKLLGDLTAAGVEIDEARGPPRARGADDRGAPPADAVEDQTIMAMAAAEIEALITRRHPRCARRDHRSRRRRRSLCRARRRRKFSRACRASSSTRRSMRRWAGGWAACSTRFSSPPPCPSSRSKTE